MLTRARYGELVVPNGFLSPGKTHALASLPPASTMLPGTLAFTSDAGLASSDGAAWSEGLGVPTLIRRRYVIRVGIDGIVSGTVDDAQAAINLASMLAVSSVCEQRSN